MIQADNFKQSTRLIYLHNNQVNYITPEITSEF